MKTWFRKTQQPIEEKSLSHPESWLLELFGSTPRSSGVSVSVETALKVPAVNAAIRLISEAAASLDVEVRSIADDGTETVDKNHPVAFLLREPNAWLSGFEFKRDLIADALMADAGGLAWVNRVNGRPVEIIHYTRGTIQVEYASQTREPNYRLNGQALRTGDVVHLRSPFNRSPLSLAREAIGVAVVLERHAARLFGRGAKPSGALQFPAGMGQEAARKAREAWRATHEGDDNGGRTAILYDGATYLPMTLNSTDTQFLENRRFQILEIARAFRTPPGMLFDLERQTWSNGEQMHKEFIAYCLEPWLLALEAALNRALFTAEERQFYRIHLDREDVTQADLQTRATAINSLIASRVLNPNEARGWLDLGPYAGGAEFINPNISEAPNGTE